MLSAADFARPRRDVALEFTFPSSPASGLHDPMNSLRLSGNVRSLSLARDHVVLGGSSGSGTRLRLVTVVLVGKPGTARGGWVYNGPIRKAKI